ncbi:MAG: hypothetical protein A2075_03235 [Geobacteraceae bacterium GWC2_58_44]|nr:MAG: hypothetical protein A2075_03235 [Geobacteraceae bacterium GWC2_58_44]HBG04219.1 hypothetical protein [Geobacter sp.]
MTAATHLWAKQLACSLLLLLAMAFPVAAGEQTTVAGHSEAEALCLGAEMYRNGMLPSGKPMAATVQGDIELTGTMSTCTNCHLRSGLGALEGGILSPPTNGARLYVPIKDLLDIPGSAMKRSMFKGGRPAYSRESLATALSTGVGPAGEQMSETMPLYALTRDEMEIMIFYLEHLSGELSPGVTDEEIRFATVVTEKTSTGDKEALLLPLNAFIKEEWNARLPTLNARQGGKLPSGGRPEARGYRKLALDVWELRGGPETWGSQLEALYRQRPVFALLGGTAPGKWHPVHEFCEKNQIPCILPDTELPVVSENDWYTLYFSKGYYQEGETAAKYLSRVFALPPGKKVVQLFRSSDQGNALARGFTDTWNKLGDAPLIDRPVAANERIDPKFWDRLASSHPDAVLLLWLDPSDLAGIGTLAASGDKPSTIFVSATMLAGDFKAIPDAVRDLILITHPTRLPGEGEYAKSVADGWMNYKKITVTNTAIAAKSYLVTRLLSRILTDMGGNLYRDYFLDIFDDGRDETNTSVLYPKLSFGPGQRYASKGCYVVSLAKGDNAKVVRQSDWVLY